MTIHREGRKFLFLLFLLLATLCFVTYLFFNLIFAVISLLSVFLFLFFLQFFRNPKRNFSIGNQNILAPADGKIVAIEKTIENEYFKDERLQVSIFMSPFNVHCNRAPFNGTVKYFKYFPGKYLVAWHPKSSTENERTTVVIENENGLQLLLRQIAGAAARRIVWYVSEGDKINQAEDFGFIKFGSRVDIFFPANTEVLVKIGDVVRGGKTILTKI